jgi:ubiquinone/menaquinone biosynthesis C-methylase UbiE
MISSLFNRFGAVFEPFRKTQRAIFMSKDVSEIKAYWDSQAKEFGADARATLADRRLRKLEILTAIKYIRRLNPNIVFDVGCGNGYSTLQFADRFPEIRFVGIDYSEEMIRIARQQKQRPNCEFRVGDVLKPETLPPGTVDLILTQRCIQNLPDYPTQKTAIENLRARLAKGGNLLLMECSKEGVAQINRVRKWFFKKPLTKLEPWCNTFFVDQNLINDFGARIDYFCSTYLFFAKGIQMRTSLLGYLLPNVGKFGHNRLYLIKGER